ncbi:MAG: SPOR domain-containing protein [Gemmatimonadota bacterium]|nr:SPOR domain-containing protein [Gemmatimonadota bacterium]
MAIVLATMAATRVPAQGGAPVPGASVAQVASRARTLADAGEGVKARELLDSLVAAQPRESLGEAEALYWRALLSETSDAAERDWKQLIVDVPFSPRAGDALLRLAELDLMRNNIALARQHVQRLLLDHPDAPERPRALLVLARTYFGDNDSPRACGVLTVVRSEAPLSAVEVRLQADELQQQCRNVHEIAMGAATDVAGMPASLPVAVVPPVVLPSTPPVTSRRGVPPVVAPPVVTSPVPPVATVAKPPASVLKSVPAPVATPPKTAATVTVPPVAAPPVTAPPVPVPPVPVPPINAPPISNNGDTAVFKVIPHPSKTPAAGRPHPVPRWTVQIAAYDTREQADALIKRLAGRHIEAHSAGTRKPFRVQVGRYATRAQATNALAALRKKGQKGFVVETGAP